MKCKVRFDFPLTIGNVHMPSQTVIVDFPTIPDRGDHISPEDDNFAPLYKLIKNYFDSNDAVIYFNLAVNVVKYVEFCNGEPVVVVGNDPDKLVVVGSTEEGELVLSSASCPPRVGDTVCGGKWYVHSVDISNDETIQLILGKEPIDEEDD